MGILEDIMGMGIYSGLGSLSGIAQQQSNSYTASQGSYYDWCKSRVDEINSKKDDSFKVETYDAEFEEVKKDEWWFKDQPKALLK